MLHICGVCTASYRTIKDTWYGGWVCHSCIAAWDILELGDRLSLSRPDVRDVSHTGAPAH